MLKTFFDAFGKLLNGLRLIAGRLEWRNDLKGGHSVLTLSFAGQESVPEILC
jgi:hypothetical protein